MVSRPTCELTVKYSTTCYLLCLYAPYLKRISCLRLTWWSVAYFFLNTSTLPPPVRSVTQLSRKCNLKSPLIALFLNIKRPDSALVRNINWSYGRRPIPPKSKFRETLTAISIGRIMSLPPIGIRSSEDADTDIHRVTTHSQEQDD